MKNKKHHTKRLINARRKALKRWKKGIAVEPTNESVSIFCSGFNMGYKIGRTHQKIPPPPQKQKIIHSDNLQFIIDHEKTIQNTIKENEGHDN